MVVNGILISAQVISVFVGLWQLLDNAIPIAVALISLVFILETFKTIDAIL